jgi:hypothetical protein
MDRPTSIRRPVKTWGDSLSLYFRFVVLFVRLIICLVPLYRRFFSLLCIQIVIC